MSRVPLAVRRAVLPELPVLILTMVAVLVAPVREAIASVPLVGPIAGLVAVLVAILMRRVRAVVVAIMIALLAPLLSALAGDAAGTVVLALVLLLNFGVIIVVRASAEPTRLAAWGVGLLALELTAVMTAGGSDPGLGAMVSAPVFAPGWQTLLPVPDIVLLMALVLVVGATVFATWRRDPIGRAVAWLVPVVLAGFTAEAAPAAAAGASLVLVATLVSSMHALAYRDALTGLPGRRAFDEALAAARPPFAVGVIDVDHFKRVNDTHGHDVGDQVLRMVADHIAGVGARGRAFRIGGEEFAVLFPGGSAGEAQPALDDLRGRIEAAPFRLRGDDRPKKKPRVPRRRRGVPQLAVTVSIGVALAAAADDLPVVVGAADRALYRAKEAGRNRVLQAGRRDYRTG